MFRLAEPPVVVPQIEHARLAGVIASHWGNERFDRPGIDFDSYVCGVIQHDWHFGLTDTFPLDDLPDVVRGPERVAKWLAITAKGVDLTLDDPLADIVAKMHIRRLLGDDTDEGVPELAARLDGILNERIAASGVGREQFAWVDRITNLCDRMAYDVFRTSVPTRQVEVCPRWGSQETVTITIHVETGQSISVDPWPLRVERLDVPVLAYDREGYPDELVPRVLMLRVEQDG